jgi:tetratricopeptide (TPR) repeat protein
VEPLLGQLTTGHVVITTRRDAGWDQIASPIRLDVLDSTPATDLLTTRTSQRDDASQAAAQAIAAELGYLPLALDQAAAYVSQTKLTLAAYLNRLRQHPAAMHAAAGVRHAERTIARVWDITIDAIQARNPDAIRLLHILACYAPDNIPRIMLGPPGDQNARITVDEGLATLASYSMITLTPESVSMHRLVQAVIRARPHPLPAQGAAFGTDPLDTALDWLDDAIPADPKGNIADWPLLRLLLPHADNLASLYPTASDAPQALGRVHNELALFLSAQGQHTQALGLQESALAITEADLGPNHPHTATALGNLAATYSEIGRYADALPLEQRALAIRLSRKRPDRTDT